MLRHFLSVLVVTHSYEKKKKNWPMHENKLVRTGNCLAIPVTLLLNGSPA